MSRYKAAAIHLTLTFLVAALTVLLMVFVWYPPPLFELLGGAGLLFLITGCDVVVGPLLTLLVFKSGKKGMTFDLCVIATVQLLALGYGMYILAIARPVYIVFVKDRFEITTPSDVKPNQWALATDPHFRQPPWTGPEYVAIKWPVQPAAQQAMMELAFQGLLLQNLPQYYAPYDSASYLVADQAKPISELRKLNPGKGKEIDDELAKLGLSENEVGFLPVDHPRGSISALVKRDHGKFLKLVNLQPWKDE